MKENFFLIFFLLLLATVKISAQKDTVVVYFDKDLQVITSEANAVYIGKAFEEEPFWKFIIKNQQTSRIILRSYYSDSTLQRLEGNYQTYFNNGVVKTIGKYQSGAETGTWQTWNENNLLTDSIIYKNGEPVFSVKYGYNDDGVLISCQLLDKEKNRKMFKSFSHSGSLMDEAEWVGKKGEVKKYYENGALAQLTKFDENGKRIFLQHYAADGTAISEKEYAKIVEKEMEEMEKELKARSPEFIGGPTRFNMYMQSNLKLPSAYTNTIHQIQTITFAFKLNDHGQAYEIKMINPMDLELEAAVKKMLESMPPWNMKGLKSYGPITYSVNLTN